MVKSVRVKGVRIKWVRVKGVKIKEIKPRWVRVSGKYVKVCIVYTIYNRSYIHMDMFVYVLSIYTYMYV
jgi:LEA14-like dessication related protein